MVGSDGAYLSLMKQQRDLTETHDNDIFFIKLAEILEPQVGQASP